MQITGENVDCLNRNNVPDKHETIMEVIDKVDDVISIDIYLRESIDCPFGRGNWLIDVRFKDKSLVCIKLPKEMSQEAVNAYCQPLLKGIYH
jgi:hypothetical protein